MFHTLHDVIAEKSTSPNKNNMYYREGWFDVSRNMKYNAQGLAELTEGERKKYREGYADAQKYILEFNS